MRATMTLSTINGTRTTTITQSARTQLELVSRMAGIVRRYADRMGVSPLAVVVMASDVEPIV